VVRMTKRLRSEQEEAYGRVWRAVRGGIRDFRGAHPEEIMPAEGSREASLIKRIVGQLVSAADGGRHKRPTEPTVGTPSHGGIRRHASVGGAAAAIDGGPTPTGGADD
jgi:hypothetical protein